jgi:hypothetical protein
LKARSHGLKMMKFLLKYSGSILLVFSVSCASSAVSQQPKVFYQPSPSIQTETKEEPKQISDVFVQADTLSEGDYSVIKLKKKVKIDETPDLTDVSYAVLKRKGKVLVQFDGVYFGLGNATDFGLFSFLGGNARQLVVSQTIPRGGRHWIVDLSPDYRVIYDSADYGVGREELSVLDIDKDGRFEVLQENVAFYGLDGFSMADTPLPLVIFKYDEQAQKYLPANHLFKDYALKNIDAKSKLLDKTLQYIYAGEEQEGWAFFDREYKGSNKEDLKSKITAILKKDSVYKFIYAKSRTR